MLDLNNPETRQSALRERLMSGSPLIVASLAEELGISVHTIRRDLQALEQKGLVRRVRGGAVPIPTRGPDYFERNEGDQPSVAAISKHAASLIPLDATIFCDGGTTMDHVARNLPTEFRGLIVTPAPSVALIALQRGATVHLIGGRVCPAGALATGGDAERAVSNIVADVCFLGACGLWGGFGLSADDIAEAGIKRAMALSSTKVIVVAAATKFERQGHHRVLRPGEIDTIVTDADQKAVDPFAKSGVEVLHV
jgi:DeoR/GlpR family transcriptional regulator of sugar metabolism